MNTVLHPGWMEWAETQVLLAAFAKAPGSLRFVGGAVRDALLGIAVKDVDAASTLTPDAVTALLQEAGIRVIPTGISHGTVTAVVGERSFEITTLRSDVATDGRHADVAFTTDWRVDAGRRDFTFNAMYLSPEGELFDYYGGAEDARAGRVRFIGDADRRIAEDYLRILRFFRFHAHYGADAPDAQAVAACARGASHMGALSGERVQAEMLKLLAAREASETLMLMQAEGILQGAFAFGVDVSVFSGLEDVENRCGLRMPPELRLAGFVWKDAGLLDALVARLRLSGKLEKQLRQLLRHKAAMGAALAVPAQKKLLRQMGAELFAALVLLRWAEAGGVSEAYQGMLGLPLLWQAPAFPVTGDDLLKRGVEAGKGMGDALKRLEALWEESDYSLSKDALLALLA